MKTLIVYFTRTNTTRLIAEELGKALAVPVEEIIDKQNWSGLLGYLKAGRAAMQNGKSEIEDFKSNIADYEMLIIGSPVWAGNMPPAIRAFIEKYKNDIKRLAVFTTQGGERRQRIFSEISALSGKDLAAELLLTTKQIRLASYQENLHKFIEKIGQSEKLTA